MASRDRTIAPMRDACTAGLWDIDPGKRCPICGALPDTRCGRATSQESKR